MTHHRGNSGFTIMEILVAIGIFAIGFVMVATIFPAAALMQKRTADKVQADQAERNANATLNGHNPSEAELVTELTSQFGASWDTDERVYPFPTSMLQGGTPPPRPLTIQDRSYPIYETVDPATETFNRKFYWVPLVRDTDPNSGAGNRALVVYVFLMQRRVGTNYSRTLGETWVNYLDGWEDANGNTTSGAAADIAVDGTGDVWHVPGIKSTFVTVTGSLQLDLVTGYNADNDGDGLNDELQIGDVLLDNNGNTLTIDDVDPGGDFVTVESPVVQSPNPVTEVWFPARGYDDNMNHRGTDSPIAPAANSIILYTITAGS